LRTLYPDMKVADVAMPYAKQMLMGRYDPSSMQGGAMFLKTLLKVQGFANDLPTQLSQILLDLESGKFSVNVRADTLDRINSNLRNIAAVGFLGLCACGFIVGAFISFAQRPWFVRGVPVLGVIALCMATGLFGAVSAWYLFGGRSRKLRLSRWMKKRP
jgi:ubiquinone biosynthesis protein